MPYIVASPYFRSSFYFSFAGNNDSIFLGVFFCIHISQVTFISLNIRSLFVQEVTRYIRNKKVSYANIDFWMLQICIFYKLI